jgi:hypothetical protein
MLAPVESLSRDSRARGRCHSVVRRTGKARQVIESDASKRFQPDRHAQDKIADEKKRGQGRVFICADYPLWADRKAKTAP